MPVHDWTRVDSGLFHDFHQGWTITLRNALNDGGLPPDYFALVDQNIRGPIPDVLTLQLASRDTEPDHGSAGLMVATQPPRGRSVKRTEAATYAARANRIAIRHRHGEIVAVIEIVSPGNKANRAEFRSFVQKSISLIQQGVHLLVVDMFPPGRRDPRGIGNAIWDEFDDEGIDLPPEKPLSLTAFDAGPSQVAYFEFVAVGDRLPAMPLFLKPECYVPAPLEESYNATWQEFPRALRGLLEAPTAP